MVKKKEEEEREDKRKSHVVETNRIERHVWSVWKYEYIRRHQRSCLCILRCRKAAVCEAVYWNIALWFTHSVEERAYVIFPHAKVFSLMYSGGTFPQGRKRKAERGVRQWRVLKIEAFFLLAKLTSCIKACTPPRMGLCLWWFKFWLFFPFSFGRNCPKKYYNFWNRFAYKCLLHHVGLVWKLFKEIFAHSDLRLPAVYMELVNTLWGNMMCLHMSVITLFHNCKRTKHTNYWKKEIPAHGLSP